jgi:ankyrin repeat protein
MKQVRFAGRNEISFNFRDPSDGNTPLHLVAATPGLGRLVSCYVGMGAHLDARNHSGRTPLHVAAELGDKQTAESLCKDGAEVDCCDSKNNTPLHYALGKVTSLTEREREACKGQELSKLIERNRERYEVAEYLLEKDADIAALNNEGWTPVASLSTSDDERSQLRLVTEYILKNLSDADLKASSIIVCAARAGLGDLVRTLIENDFDVNARREDGMTALAAAYDANELEIIELLLLNGADDSALILKDGCNPLTSACYMGNKALVKVLLENGAAPDGRGLDGKTALHHACDYESQVKTPGDLVAMLLVWPYKANPDETDDKGRTALHYAAEKSNKAITLLLLAEGADPSFKDKAGSKPDLSFLHDTFGMIMSASVSDIKADPDRH